ncbi:MAG: hypothetical protein ACRDRO_21795, partial [Pseudonocardiaceae bacterium]
CQGDEFWCWWVFGAFGGGDDREDGVGEHREQSPAPPWQPTSDLVLIKTGQALGCLRWVGRAARCLLGRSFSAQPPAEPDVPAFRASRLSSDYAVNVLAGCVPWMRS